MNRYPLWKYLLILAVLVVGTVYALPNLYPEDPAIQVSPSGSSEVTEGTLQTVESVLKQQGYQYKSAKRRGDSLLVRFNDTETQLAAVDVIKAALGNGYVAAVNLAPSTPEWLRLFDAKPMYLGLDLRGGVYFLMEVDMQGVLKRSYQNYAGEFRSFLREKNIRYADVSDTQRGVVLKFRDAKSRDAAENALQSQYHSELAFSSAQTDSGFELTAAMSKQAQAQTERFAVDQNMTTLRKRVNELGVAEPVIQQQGVNRIVVQLPGVQDTARAKEILGATAALEFRLVDEQANPYDAVRSGEIPPGDKLYHERNGQPILLKNRVMLTGDYITDASSGLDQQSGTPAVFITLDGKGARLFSRATRENVKKLMAVVYIETKPEVKKVGDKLIKTTRKVEEVINVARIQEQLSKRFQITGLDNPREARNLALLLRAGALAAPMQIVEERTVGPSLGKDNIEQGFKSAVIGLILVVIFMALYYRVFGLIANLALVLNLVLIVAIMSMIQATLTLPGIAGITLTIGMAVDANVLIFERIREELRNGNSPQASIQAGYERAFGTIADSNITTLIAALILFIFGTGPVKGFAVTLSIGIATSMFTAIMGTRAVVNLIYGRRRVKSLAV
ncbi:MAG: protein translocase subunit SecD [Gammaproteobacteria bacterium]